MSKTSVVTREAVWHAADAIQASGAEVRSAKQVRDEMANSLPPGSKIGAAGKIHDYLMEWRERQAGRVEARGVELSAALVNVLQIELKASADRVRDQLASERDSLLLDAQDLAERNVALEAEIHQLNSDVAARTSERDEALGALDECRENLARTSAAAERAADLHEMTTRKLAAAEADRAVLRHSHDALERELHQASQTVRSLQEQLCAAVESLKSATERADAAEMLADQLKAQGAQRRPLTGQASRAIAGRPMLRSMGALLSGRSRNV